MRRFVIFLLLSCAAAQSLPTAKSVLVFGRNISYFDVGSGPTVVLLHGLGANKESWGGAIPALAPHYRVLVPDQIGFGHSAKPPLDYHIQTYVDFLAEFLRQLQVEHATLVGHSLGGWIAAAYALQGPRDSLPAVDKLVLVDSAGLKPDAPWPPYLNPSSLADTRKLLADIFYDPLYRSDEAARFVFAQILASNAGYTVHELLTNPVVQTEYLDRQLAALHVPTLVIWARQDRLLPLAYGQRLAAAIPGARLAVIDRCGHELPIEQPQQFLAAAEPFLAGRGATQ